MKEILSQNPAQTISLGLKLAQFLEPGDLIALIGELGSGKTTLIKGMARGLKVEGKEGLLSPSFVILKEYKGRLPLYHFDFYRLDSVEEICQIGYEEYFYGDGVTVVEWAQKAEELIPPEHLRIELIIAGEKKRLLRLIPKGGRYQRLVGKIKLG